MVLKDWECFQQPQKRKSPDFSGQGFYSTAYSSFSINLLTSIYC